LPLIGRSAENRQMNPHSRLLAAALAVATLAGTFALPASAGSFTVVPVRLYFGPRDRAVAVTLANTGTTSITLQAELYAWSQAPDGSDILKPTDDLILAPPIIKLAAGGQQVVRLALLRPIDPERQLSYRMFMREMPEVDPTKQDTVAIPVTLALNIPVFVTPPIAQRTVTCATQRAGTVLRLVCENTGNAYAMLREVVLKRGDAELARFDGGAYVLPGVKRPVALEAKGPITPGPAQLFMSFDDNQQVLADEIVP
jgi:fimbrial chaperone protein